MTYDPKCYDLATIFLQDYPELNDEKNRRQIARSIQRAIEDDIEELFDTHFYYKEMLDHVED